jgi:hypothetical protein
MLKEREVVRSARKEENFLSREHLFYDQFPVKVRPIKKSDRFELKASDQLEVFYSHGYRPEEALPKAIEQTLEGFTVLVGEKPEICFGINSYNLLGNEAVIWMLSSEKIKDINLRFARHSRIYIDYFLTYYRRLINYVYVGNSSSIQWLKFLGAKFDRAEPYGVYQRHFMRFTFER